MADDDETGELAPSDDSIGPGPRRSTFEPPESGGSEHDDDALADALAAEFARIASGPSLTSPIPTVVAPDEPPVSAYPPPADPAPTAAPTASSPPPFAPPPVDPVFSDRPVDAAPAGPEQRSEPAQAQPEPQAEPEPQAQPAAEADAAPQPEPQFEPLVPEPVAWQPPAAPEPPAQQEQPAWMNAPAPDPAQAVDLPEGPPQRPVRRSLPDDQLAGWVDEAAKQPGGTLNLIESLESQLKLREEEAREFQAWESTMRTVGTPDAIAEVEEARPEFTGVLPDLAAPASLVETPERAEEPVPEPLAESAAIPEPWAPPLVDEGEASRGLEPSAEPAFTEPASTEPTSAEPVFEEPVFEEPDSSEPEPEPAANEPDAAPAAPSVDAESSTADAPFQEPDFDALLAPPAETEPVESEPAAFESASPAPVDLPPEELYRAPTGWYVPPAMDTPPEGPAASAPSEDAPADEAPAEDAPAEEAPAEEAPAEEAPAEEAPAEEAPAEEAPADEAPATFAPADVEEPSAALPDSVVAPDAQFASWVPPQPDEPQERRDLAREGDPGTASAGPSGADDAPVAQPTFDDLLVAPPLVEPSTAEESAGSDSSQGPALTAPEAFAPEAPAPDVPAQQESFFLPEPAYEPLHPTHPIETIARGQGTQTDGLAGADDLSDDGVADAAVAGAAVGLGAATVTSSFAPPPAPAPPFAPPALVEPRPYGAPAEAPAEPASPARDAPVADAAADAPADADADAIVLDPAPAVVQEGGFPLGEQFFGSKDVEAAPSSFDDLLAGAPEEGELVGVARDPDLRLDAETLFIEPMPASAGEPPVATGSITIIDQAYQEEIDEDVDETDRVVQAFGPVSVDTSGIAVVPSSIAPPSGPISTVRIREDEAVLAAAPRRLRAFSLEASGMEPTPLEYRVGRAARLFWLWFAPNSSILSLGLGAVVFGLGLSLSQSIVAILAGVALSFLPLGLTTLAGKRSGQPTMVVSRATFGLLGNVLPAVLALISRLFWGAVMLWFLATSLPVVLVGGDLNGSLSENQLVLLGLAGGLAIALLIAFFGYAMLARIQLFITIISSILVIGLIALTWQEVDLEQARQVAYGPWEVMITGAVLVFSFLGLVWANSGGDLARYQRPESSGGSSMLWATFGAAVPAFVLIAYGALLAASNDGISSGFQLSPLDTLALMLPLWYPVPLLAATALSLLSGVALTIYSGGFALQAIGVRVPRPWSVPIVGVLLAGVALLITFAVPGGTLELFRDGATTLAVPIAAWAGIFAAEMMIRNRRFESQSLLQRGGVYPDVRWLNLIALVVITAIGWGLTTATVTWLSWQGYLWGILAVPIDSNLAGTDGGVLIALVLGLLVPIVAGIPGIRRQEAIELNAQ